MLLLETQLITKLMAVNCMEQNPSGQGIIRSSGI
jgi:hypothetical protein